MSISTPFIGRPIATTLLTIALALAGGVAYRFLPVSQSMSRIDNHTILQISKLYLWSRLPAPFQLYWMAS